MRPLLSAVVTLGLACCGIAHADEAKPPSEATMLITGTITLNGDGTVRSYTVDRANRLPPSVSSLIQTQLPGWKFQPPEDHPDGISGKMTLRMLARPIDDKRDRVSIAGATFYSDPQDSSRHVTYKSRAMPNYPTPALRMGESATVYLMLRVGRDGHVMDVYAEQVNLDAYASSRLMKEFREMFAESATRAARHWTYNVPTQGKSAQ